MISGWTCAWVCDESAVDCWAQFSSTMPVAYNAATMHRTASAKYVTSLPVRRRA